MMWVFKQSGLGFSSYPAHVNEKYFRTLVWRLSRDGSRGLSDRAGSPTSWRRCCAACCTCWPVPGTGLVPGTGTAAASTPRLCDRFHRRRRRRALSTSCPPTTRQAPWAAAAGEAPAPGSQLFLMTCRSFTLRYLSSSALLQSRRCSRYF